jgi:hypothetical protein
MNKNNGKQIWKTIQDQMVEACAAIAKKNGFSITPRGGTIQSLGIADLKFRIMTEVKHDGKTSTKSWA